MDKKRLIDELEFTDLFDVEEIQKIQDAFAKATGVASIITTPDGVPITKPSNFCRLCQDIIRKTEKGLCNCFKSDAVIGRYNPEGPIIQPCLSGGLWDGGASISVEKRHIANWLIGQVRNEDLSQEKMLKYADEIGADKNEFKIALDEVTIMSLDQFKNVGDSLFLIANMLSQMAYQKAEHKFMYESIKEQNIKLKVTQDELKKSEQNYRQIFNATNEAIFIHDAKTGEILDVNETMLKMFECKKEDVLGLSASKFSLGVSPYGEKEAVEHIKKAFETGHHIFEWISRKLNGETFWTEVALQLATIDDNSRLIAVVRDINERKKTQQLIVQTEKMMSVGGLAAGMAHEINNPLGAIVQGIQNVFRRLSPEIKRNREVAKQIGIDLYKLAEYINEREIEYFLMSVKDAGMRAANIVKDMLNFSRQSDTKRSLEEVSSLIDETIDIASHNYDLSKKHDFKKINIIKKFQADLQVRCVKSEIQQVLLNLLKNGADVMNEKLYANDKEKSDILYSPEFTIRTYAIDHFACIEIEDNGIGIDEENVKRVFDPFYTTKPVGKGTGLGLSVSYFIITQNHNGKMWLESELGKGTKFVIELPI